MRINHNIASMIGEAANTRVNQSLEKSLQRLSTGMRITRASDDAAGLSVSEEMRTQITGGQMAERNITDAMSFMKIADGALEEVGESLKRMRELAVQGSNDTLTRTERAYLQTEYEALRNEIERITKVTQYNGITLFEKNTQLAGSANQALGRYGDGTALDAVANTGFNPLTGVQTVANGLGYTGDDTSGGRVFTFQIGPDGTAKLGSDATFDLYESVNMLNIALSDMSATSLFLQQGFTTVGPGTTYTREDASLFEHRLNDAAASDMQYTSDGLTAVYADPAGPGGPALYISASESCMNTIAIIDGVDRGGVNGSAAVTEEHVTGLKRINSVRSYVGSVINRLDHALQNLKNQNYNTQSAESNIRDADFAAETADFTKSQILSQSSTSMLAQANSAPNLILSLIR